MRVRMRKKAGRRVVLSLLVGLLLGGLLALEQPEAQSQAPRAPIPPEAREWAHSAIEQLSVAIREAVFAWPASDLSELRLRAARVLNVLVGEESPEYRAQAGRPPGADGVGAIVYLERLQRALSGPAEQGNEQARSLLFALGMVQYYAAEAKEALSAAGHADGLPRARRSFRQALAFLLAARGSREDPPSEGGVRALYRELEGP